MCQKLCMLLRIQACLTLNSCSQGFWQQQVENIMNSTANFQMLLWRLSFVPDTIYIHFSLWFRHISDYWRTSGMYIHHICSIWSTDSGFFCKKKKNTLKQRSTMSIMIGLRQIRVWLYGKSEDSKISASVVLCLKVWCYKTLASNPNSITFQLWNF